VSVIVPEKYWLRDTMPIRETTTLRKCWLAEEHKAKERNGGVF
jgi:hypothetical protein